MRHILVNDQLDALFLSVFISCLYMFRAGARGGAAFKVLRYKSEGRWFDSRWCHNPSDRTMALGSTQTLTEMNTRNISWG
jgi:hypothetical protein